MTNTVDVEKIQETITETLKARDERARELMDNDGIWRDFNAQVVRLQWVLEQCVVENDGDEEDAEDAENAGLLRRMRDA